MSDEIINILRTGYFAARGAHGLVKGLSGIFSDDDGGEDRSPEEDDGPPEIHIAILGARQSGKSRMAEFLAQGTLSDSDYRPTSEATRLSVGWLRLCQTVGITDPTDDESLKVATCVFHDVPGSNAYEEWKDSFEAASICLYVVRTDKLLSRDRETESRIRDDIETMFDWMNNMNEDERPEIIFVGTHYDLLDPSEDHGRRVEELPLIQELSDRDDMQGATMVFGSMRSRREAKTLLFKVFE